MELTVNITADGNRCADWLDIALLDENLLDLLAEDSEVSFRENTATLDDVKPLVDINVRSHIFLVVFKSNYNFKE